MLRGNYTARIDAKGRLKVPTVFRRHFEEQYKAADFYITSLSGENTQIYPLAEWEKIEQRLALLPSMDKSRRKFVDRTSYYGQEAAIDEQGRLLIHPLLRQSAGIYGDLFVIGQLSYLDVWDAERYQQQRLSDPYTDDDAAALARLGI